MVITHKIPLLGEKRVAHIDVKVTDVSVTPLLTTETLLEKHIFHLKNKANATLILISKPFSLQYSIYKSMLQFQQFLIICLYAYLFV